jgi:hypothetical protein
MNETAIVFCRPALAATLLLCFWIQPGIAAEKIRIATGGLAASSATVWAALETKSFQKRGNLTCLPTF